MVTKVAYAVYLKSDEWAAKREQALEHHGRKCRKCGRTEHLQVHHRTYARLGRERMSDLEVLYRNCHARRHHKIKRGRGIPIKARGS